MFASALFFELKETVFLHDMGRLRFIKQRKYKPETKPVYAGSHNRINYLLVPSIYCTTRDRLFQCI